MGPELDGKSGDPVISTCARVGKLSITMALDPRIRAELERRGPVNVKELLRTLAGPGPNVPVAVQLDEVPDPIRADVEDWLREKEQEAEAVSRDTLKWAKIAGLAAIIGVVVTAFIGIASIFVTQHIARRAIAEFW
jgi:hypothetical protein